jgi:hypothetical protein
MHIINFIKSRLSPAFHMNIDLPRENALERGTVDVHGWAFSQKAPIKQVSAQIGCEPAVAAEYGIERVDVQRHFQLQNPYCGFYVQLPVGDELEGLQTLRVRAIDESGRTIEQEVSFRAANSRLEIERVQWQREHIQASGWFYWRSSQPPYHISLFLNDEPLGQAAANYSRPDIREHFLLNDDIACRGFRAVFAYKGHLQAAQLRIQLYDAREESIQTEQWVEVQSGTAISDLAQTAQQAIDQYSKNPGVLLWNVPVLDLKNAQVFQPPFPNPDKLPYPDKTIDMVIALEKNADEARRVARIGILLVRPDGAPLDFQMLKAPHASEDNILIHGTPSGRHVLFCLPFLPAEDFNSGARHSSNEVKMFLEAGWRVSIWAINRIAQGGTEEQTAACVRTWEACGVSFYAGPDTRWADEDYMPHLRPLLEKQHFDLAIIAHWQTAALVLPWLRAYSPHTRTLIDSIDTHFLREARQSFLKQGCLDSKYASDMVSELNSYGAADGVLAISEKEQGLLSDFLGETTPVYHLPLLEQRQISAVPFGERRGVVFIGNFLHLPNRDAVQNLIQCIYPYLPISILRNHPIYIVGTAAAEYLDPAIEQMPYVHVAGWVPDLDPILHQARISVVPLRYGAGVKGKMLVAMAAGTPVVTTSIGVEGMSLEYGKHAFIENTPEAFAQAMVRLLTDENAWTSIAQQAKSYVEDHHGMAVVKRYFWQAVHSVCS